MASTGIKAAIGLGIALVAILLIIYASSNRLEAAPPVEAELPAIHLFSEKNFQGQKTTLVPGMRALLAEFKVGSWNFLWKSMQVHPGIKLIFARSTGGGRNARGYAVGYKNVADIEGYMRSVPIIGSNYSIDTGVGLERDFGGKYEPVYIMVADDDLWKAMQQDTHQGCLKTVEAWNRSKPGAYNASYCNSSDPSNLAKTVTL
jgi:hypothetical protein